MALFFVSAFWALPLSASPTQAGASAATASPSGAAEANRHEEEAARRSDAPAAHGLVLPVPPEDFSTFENDWLQIAYHPSLAARVRVLEGEANAFKRELAALLGKPVLDEVHVMVGRTAGEMELLAPEGARFPRYASGVAFSELGLILLTAEPRYPGQQHDLAEVFHHELAHVALHDAVGRERVPRWFNEGFAIHASKESQGARLQALWTATVSGNLLPFKQITNSFPADDVTASVAYAQAADMVRFLLRTGEEHRFVALVRRMGHGQEFAGALADSYSTDMFSLETAWLQDVSKRYTFWPVIFGGSLIWVFAFGLMIWGYTQRRRRAAVKLARWAKEEALEDARRQLARAVFVTHPVAPSAPEELPAVSSESRIVHIHLQSPVPTVEHDGERYTLH